MVRYPELSVKFEIKLFNSIEFIYWDLQQISSRHWHNSLIRGKMDVRACDKGKICGLR
jgi:hypothetical protein